MNIFTLLMLSTKRQAQSNIILSSYQVVVSQDNSDYVVEIFRITYPDRRKGQGMGAMSVAETPHYTAKFGSRADLGSFLEDFQGIEWTPVEEDE